MRRLSCAVMLLAAGCGAEGDPATRRFKPGESAILYANTPEIGNVVIHPIDGQDVGNPVAIGTRVVVASDESPDPATKDDAKAADRRERAAIILGREVRVRVAEGPHEGMAGIAHRKNLRPAPK